RVQLDERPAARAGEGLVALDGGDRPAGRRALVAALPGGPGAEGAEGALQRLDLADAAALLVAVVVEAEEALLLHEGLERRALGRHEGDLDAVAAADGVDEAVGLG